MIAHVNAKHAQMRQETTQRSDAQRTHKYRALARQLRAIVENDALSDDERETRVNSARASALDILRLSRRDVARAYLFALRHVDDERAYQVFSSRASFYCYSCQASYRAVLVNLDTSRVELDESDDDSDESIAKAFDCCLSCLSSVTHEREQMTKT